MVVQSVGLFFYSMTPSVLSWIRIYRNVGTIPWYICTTNLMMISLFFGYREKCSYFIHKGTQRADLEYWRRCINFKIWPNLWPGDFIDDAMSAQNITCTTRHHQLCTCKVLYMCHQHKHRDKHRHTQKTNTPGEKYHHLAIAADKHFYQSTLTSSYFPFLVVIIISITIINSLRLRQNRRHFAEDVFKCNFLNGNVWIPIKISLKFVPTGPINNIPALVQIMAWRRPGDKPLPEPMMDSLPTHICIIRPQWVNNCVFIKWQWQFFMGTMLGEFRQISHY